MQIPVPIGTGGILVFMKSPSWKSNRQACHINRTIYKPVRINWHQKIPNFGWWNGDTWWHQKNQRPLTWPPCSVQQKLPGVAADWCKGAATAAGLEDFHSQGMSWDTPARCFMENPVKMDNLGYHHFSGNLQMLCVGEWIFSTSLRFTWRILKIYVYIYIQY